VGYGSIPRILERELNAAWCVRIIEDKWKRISGRHEETRTPDLYRVKVAL
jgi:hypothetical protein